MPADKYFYIDPTDETVGPVSWGVLLQLERAGAVAGETLVAPESASDWMPFSEVKAKEEARSKLPPVPSVSVAETISATPVASAVGEEVRGRPIQRQMTTVPTQSSRASTAQMRPNRTRLVVGLAVGALIFSFVPILVTIQVSCTMPSPMV